MPATPLISSYLVSAMVAAFVAAGAFDNPPALVSADQSPRHSAHAIVDAAFAEVAAPRVDRAHKSDRLPVSRADPVTNTTIVPKDADRVDDTVPGANGTPAPHKIIDVDDGKPAPKLAPAPPLECEAAASPIADPTLSRFVGRCFV
jgi:hypothetical protein